MLSFAVLNVIMLRVGEKDVDEKGRCLNWLVDEKWSWWRSKLMKRDIGEKEVDETAILQNGKLMKWQDD